LNLKINDIECKGSIHEYIKKLASHQRAIFLDANITQDLYDKRRKASYYRNRYDISFEIGDNVTLFNGDNKVGKKKKFSPKWIGIWIVIKKYGSNAVRIEELTTKVQKKVNVSKLKHIHWHMDQTI